LQRGGKGGLKSVPGTLLLLALVGCNRTEPTGPIVADAAKGERVFAQLCGSCHKAGPNARNAFGPQLNGVIGRRAGSLQDYAYSPALRRADFVWDQARLQAYVADPSGVVPGTKMYFWGLSDRQKVADLLAYLENPAGH
jgi:cytochrome c